MYDASMPDWSYRTLLRPCMLALGAERARRLATSTLSTLSHLPFGPAAIDFLGHMRADERLRTRLGTLALPGPIALGSLIDPSGKACRAFARFGVGLLEIGPVAAQTKNVVPQWRTDFLNRTIEASCEIVAGLDEVAHHLERADLSVAICVRISETDPASIATIVARLQKHARLFSIDAGDTASAEARVSAVKGLRPVLLRIAADTRDYEKVAAAAMKAGAEGVWICREVQLTLECVQTLRRSLPDVWIIAGGVTEPDDARLLLEAGANVAATDAGLVVSGPGLIKRCNEALLSMVPARAEPEPLTLDAARRSWFWAFLLGVGMFAGGLLAIVIASTRVVLPYDESLAGMTRAQLATLNSRLLAFMAHDRASLAGTMLSIGIFYAALAWNGIRHGAHWAQVTVIASATTGFFTFFFFLGFGYFDPFHAFVTAILTQFMLLCMVLAPSPPQPVVAQWREDAAWRRGQWGQLLFVMIGVVLTGAGTVIAAIGCTSVFVETDLEFMRTTREQLHHSYETLIPLVAHDRASLGGMLIANGIAVWLMAQWGFRAGARWLWVALAWGGNLAFACATVVHVVVGYHSPLHLAPAMLGWVMWNVALALSREWMAQRT
jgi:dihydroorotate dehydrogenase